MTKNDEVVREYVETKEVPMVELKICVSKEFFDTMKRAKTDVAKKRGFDISYGTYIEQAMDDMVYMIESLNDQLTQEQYVKELPEVKDNTEDAHDHPEHMYS